MEILKRIFNYLCLIGFSIIFLYGIAWFFTPIFPLPFFTNFPLSIISSIEQGENTDSSYYTATRTHVYYKNNDSTTTIVTSMPWLTPWNTTVLEDVIAIKGNEVYARWKPIDLDATTLEVVTSSRLSYPPYNWLFGWKIFSHILYLHDDKNVYNWTARYLGKVTEETTPYDLYLQDKKLSQE